MAKQKHCPTEAPLMTLADAAEYLSVSETTVRRMVSGGKLRAFRLGRGLRFVPSDVIDLPTLIPTMKGNK